MFDLKTHDQGIIALDQQDYLAILIESFLIKSLFFTRKLAPSRPFKWTKSS